MMMIIRHNVVNPQYTRKKFLVCKVDTFRTNERWTVFLLGLKQNRDHFASLQPLILKCSSISTREYANFAKTAYMLIKGLN